VETVGFKPSLRLPSTRSTAGQSVSLSATKLLFVDFIFEIMCQLDRQCVPLRGI
jgi:hypothetical protein